MRNTVGICRHSNDSAASCHMTVRDEGADEIIERDNLRLARFETARELDVLGNGD